MEQKSEDSSQKAQKNLFERVRKWYRGILKKKPYLEFLTAILTIPFLIIIMIVNLNVLRSKDDTTPTPTPEQVIVTIPGTSEERIVTATQPDACIQELGPINITSPKEDETVTDNPVSVRISYQQGDYCAAVWSYRINGGRWSDYDDASIALYNPPQGDITLELRVKSIVGDDEEILTRHFTYEGETTLTPTTASASAN